MAEVAEDTRSYPYMSANQWWGLRNRFKKSVPTGPVTLEWIIGALDTTQKGAGNVLPQLRVLGLTDAANRVTDLVYDLKDDETYRAATQAILASAYPTTLLEAHDDPAADPNKVAGWFGRYAKTGERTSISQAKLYLLILSGELPDPDDMPLKPKASRPPAKRPAPTAGAVRATHPATGTAAQASTVLTPAVPNSAGGASGPTLHVDLQIHIAADAGDAQIDAIFKSMAKHLYGK